MSLKLNIERHLNQRQFYVLLLTDGCSFDFVYVQNSGFLHGTYGGNLPGPGCLKPG